MMNSVVSLACRLFVPRDLEHEEYELPEAIASQSSSDSSTIGSTIISDPSFIHIPRRRGVVVTPAGLLPRKSFAEIRLELGIPDSPGSVAPKEQDPTINRRILRVQHQSYSKTSSMSSPESSEALAPIHEEQNDLLDLPSRPTRSWTPSTTSGYSSPPPSQANSSQWTAESPHLIPGLTRTAVGNLFALQTSGMLSNPNDPPGTTPLKSTTQGSNDDSQQWNYSPQEDRVEDMFSPLTAKSQTSKSEQIVEKATTALFSPCLLSDPRPRTTRTKEVIIDKWKNIDMQGIKARNQKHQKGDLVLQVFERVQDNTDLIQDLQSLYYCKIQFHHPLLTGLPEKSRYEVLDRIDMILRELNQDATSDFFFSPGKIELKVDHSELKTALVITRSLVELAIPESEKETSSLTASTGYWKFLYHESVGLSVPDTPTANESYFSLPEAATTPMTSNVSLGNSTLTTRPQTTAGIPHHDGLELRQALQNYSHSLQLVGTAVEQLLDTNELFHAIESIKKGVTDLWKLSTTELTSMVDAFEFILEEDKLGGSILHANFLGSGSVVSREDDDDDGSVEDDLRQIGSIDEGDYERDEEEDDMLQQQPSWQVYL